MAERHSNEGLADAPRFRRTLGRRIRLIRQQRGWSQEVLAELAEGEEKHQRVAQARGQLFTP